MVFVPCRGKNNIKKKLQESFLSEIFEILVCFWAEKLPIWEKNILFSQHVGGKNKIKLKCQFFLSSLMAIVDCRATQGYSIHSLVLQMYLMKILPKA